MQDLLKDVNERMQKACEVLRKELAALRAGRASPALLEKIEVDYYGVPTPVNQVATITAPDARLLVVQPWDKSLVPKIEKAILKSDLGVNPTSDGTVVRIPIPPLTEERRKEMVKVVRKKGEEARVAIRNVRRDGNERVKGAEKEGLISEDQAKRTQEEIQKLTDKYIKEVDRILEAKEEEILAS
ncbi:MAG: ribosome recycling factor [Clostridia bacterium]|jgi:ribosome recycling factor|nr:ribosome recycling factor [Clostridia bacterium]MDH7572393.1 ribosome recycling factor [Clostridia bacterium]